MPPPKKIKIKRAPVPELVPTEVTTIESPVEVSPLPEPTGVPIESLKQEFFEYEGGVYQILSREPGYIIANFMEWGPAGGYRVPRYRRPIPYGTLVRVIE